MSDYHLCPLSPHRPTCAESSQFHVYNTHGPGWSVWCSSAYDVFWRMLVVNVLSSFGLGKPKRLLYRTVCFPVIFPVEGIAVLGRQMLRPSSIAIIGLIIFIADTSNSSFDSIHVYTILLSMAVPIAMRLLPWPFSPYRPAYNIISDYYQSVHALFRRECSVV